MKNLIPVLALSITIVTGCAKNEPPKTRSSAYVESSLGGAGAKTSGNDSGALGTVLCENPISLDEVGLSPLKNESDMPEGKYRLTQMRMYALYEATGKSYTALSKESEDFSVSLECNGVKNFTSDDAENELTSTFSVSDVFGKFAKESEYERLLKVSFKGGIVTSTISKLRPRTPIDMKLKEIPLERIALPKDQFVTVRVYQVDVSHMEMRMKFEFPANADGKRQIVFSTATYEKTESAE